MTFAGLSQVTVAEVVEIYRFDLEAAALAEARTTGYCRASGSRCRTFKLGKSKPRRLQCDVCSKQSWRNPTFRAQDVVLLDGV